MASFTLIKCVVPFHDSKLMQVIFDLSPWEYSLWETYFAHGPNLETVVINTTSLKKQDEPLFPQEYVIVGPLAFREHNFMTLGKVQQHDSFSSIHISTYAWIYVGIYLIDYCIYIHHFPVVVQSVPCIYQPFLPTKKF